MGYDRTVANNFLTWPNVPWAREEARKQVDEAGGQLAGSEYGNHQHEGSNPKRMVASIWMTKFPRNLNGDHINPVPFCGD